MPLKDKEKRLAFDCARGGKWAKAHPKRHRENGAQWRKQHPKRDQEIQRKSQRRLAGCINATGEVRGGACEICKQVYPTLHYDHSHVTGLHRGWLCCWCNLKLGWFEKWRTQIEKYLEK